jgi:pimeloyl-ACP methyl ester carboxylesterase
MTYYRTVDVLGAEIFYREAGSPDRPTLLLLHGFPASSFMFRELIPMLAAEFHVIAPDYPGFGHSAAPDRAEFAYTFDHLTDVVEAFTERLGMDRYALYLQDFGGPVGFRLAARHPERVSFLVVQNANAYEEGLPDSFWDLPRELWNDPTEANRAKIAEAAMSADALAWNYTHGVADVERISPDSWALQAAQLARPGAWEAMKDLLYDYRTNPPLYPVWQEYFRTSRPPTLVVWGRNDQIFPESGALPFRRDLPDVDLNLLETGHFALEDHAEVIAQRILEFGKRAYSTSDLGQDSVDAPRGIF